MTRDEIQTAIGYVRVSTADQGDTGAGLEAQRQAIEQAARQRRWTLLGTYEDVASGKTLNGRKQLEQALAELRAGRAHALLVAKLDRVSRSVKDFARLLEDSQRQSWALVALDFDLDTSTPAGELVAHVMMAVAQWERRVIGQRTREGLAVKRAQGVKLGGRRLVTSELEARIVQLRRQGLSFETIADLLTIEGVSTPKGGRVWGWTTVKQIVRRNMSEPIQKRS
jgi:DNA invertase Pin-like site-specific DNA recombinase